VHARLATLQHEFPDFHVAVIEDPAPFVRQSISNLWQAVWFGGLLAFGALLYFLNDLASPVILMTTLPVAVLASFAILDVMGVSLNIMSLGGIALSVGTLVDNSIIALDNMHRLRLRGLPPARAASEGAREVSLPMLASTFTTLSVFVPLAAVPGRFGALFRDQAATVAVSQVVSLMVSLTLLPMLAARVQPPRPPRRARAPPACRSPAPTTACSSPACGGRSSSWACSSCSWARARCISPMSGAKSCPRSHPRTSSCTCSCRLEAMSPRPTPR